MRIRSKAHGPDTHVLPDKTSGPSRHHGGSSAQAPESLEISGHQIAQPESYSFSAYETSMKNARSADRVGNQDVVCGPLLNYRYIDGDQWIGSVLIVTKGDGDIPRQGPTLFIRQSISGNSGESSASQSDHYAQVEGVLLHSEKSTIFWRFDICVTMGRIDSRWEFKIANAYFLHPERGLAQFFVVPSYHESMRVMFYSCNGWCDGAEEGEWNQLSLWKDVLRRHANKSFHVMIGGGDQIYNDGIYTSGPLREWTKIEELEKRLEYQPTAKLQSDTDDWYLENYIQWYGTEPFASALSQIPSLNMWDDHDIIDGFGSYAKKTMTCPVFRMIGAIAHKYYMLFQHHLPPNMLATAHDSHPAMSKILKPEYILGQTPGPYISALSHSIFTRLGARLAFVGVDARTERTREQINYPATYDTIFARVNAELSAAAHSGRPINHLIFLYGIPLAYPPLTLIEDAFEGTAGHFFKKLNIGNNAINPFDGEIELMDDLNDHYTSRAHADERRHLIERIQFVCAAHSVRVTILSGDVHLAAVGRFFTTHRGTKPPIEEDFRFMNNIISSAIVNQPPPAAMAKLIAQGDKIRQLNAQTEETLFKLFYSDSSNSKTGPAATTVAMPRRNYSIITENSPNNPGRYEGIDKLSLRQFFAKRGHRPLHFGEANAGTRHIATSEQHGKGNDGSLDVCICVEIDHQQSHGQTEAYGFTIPTLKYRSGEA